MEQSDMAQYTQARAYAQQLLNAGHGTNISKL
jgi:hypothetical protein